MLTFARPREFSSLGLTSALNRHPPADPPGDTTAAATAATAATPATAATTTAARAAMSSTTRVAPSPDSSQRNRGVRRWMKLGVSLGGKGSPFNSPKIL